MANVKQDSCIPFAEVTLVGGQKILAHPPEKCEGRPCCVHRPSRHHMRNWKQNWRDDRQIMERLCEHGVGHPDPDHLSHVRELVGPDERVYDGIHGCDGCCRPELTGDIVARHAHLRRQSE